MQNMTLGNLSFICGPTPSQQYGCTVDPDVQGLDSPDYRVVHYPNPGQDYARVSSALYDARTITFSGYIIGQNPTDYLAKRQALSQANLISRDQYGYPSLTKFSFTAMDGNSYFLMVQPKKPIFAHTNLTWTKYQLTLVAPDARIYGANQQTSGNISTLIGGGFTFPVTFPITFGSGSGGSGIITNNGTLESHPTVTFYGPLTNPYIYNQATGYGFQLDYTIPGGSYVTVDMYNKVVTLNGSSGLISTVDSISTWWTVVPGANPVTLSTSNSSDTGYVSLTAYSAWAAI